MHVRYWLLSLAFLGAAHGQTLSLDEALRIAEARSPQLAAQRASAEAAGALIPAAGENPDPKLFFGIENLPTEGADRWSLSADFMTMRRVGVMQEFVRGEKRELRTTRAGAEAQRETAVVEMQRADLRKEVATAWLERHYAERARELLRSLEREAGLQLEIATAEVSAGKGSAADAIGARSLRVTLLDRSAEAEQKARRATAMLGRWLGAEAARPLGAPPDILAIAHHASGLTANLESHPHLAMYAPMEAAALAEMRLAAAATKPDWTVELSYAQRGSAYADMVSIMVRVDLPFFAPRRQDPVAASRKRSCWNRYERRPRTHGAVTPPRSKRASWIGKPRARDSSATASRSCRSPKSAPGRRPPLMKARGRIWGRARSPP
jgi:outer membrane protein TolC